MEIQNDNIERVVTNLSLQITFKDRYDADNTVVTVNIGDWVQVLTTQNGERVIIKGEVHNIICDLDFYYDGSLTILIRNNSGVIGIPVKDVIDIHFNKNYSYPIELEKEKTGRSLTNSIISELDGGESNAQ